jgi:hypothetical protein
MPRIEADRLGSDHCPVVMNCTVELETGPNANVGITAALCAKNFAEFSGTQQSIKSFVVRNRGANGNVEGASDSQASPAPSSGSGAAVSKPKRRASRGQQSITSFFSQAGVKRKSPSFAREGEAATRYQAFSGGVTIVARTTKGKTAEEGKLEWQQVLSGRPPPTPLCHCGLPTVLRSVAKANENWGRKFYVCTKPAVRLERNLL